jgi:hypothetical protein
MASGRGDGNRRKGLPQSHPDSGLATRTEDKRKGKRMQLVVAVLRIVLAKHDQSEAKKEFNAEDTETEHRTG